MNGTQSGKTVPTFANDYANMWHTQRLNVTSNKRINLHEDGYTIDLIGKKKRFCSALYIIFMYIYIFGKVL